MSATAAGADMRGTATVAVRLAHAAQSMSDCACLFSGIRSRRYNSRPSSFTLCGQPCGQPGGFRGSKVSGDKRPQRRSGVPTSMHPLSTSATRWAACGDRGRSTLSTGLTTAVAVSSSRTLLLNNRGDESHPRWSGPTPTAINGDRRYPRHGRCSGPTNTDPG